jgi:Nucleoside 2-deoxyribosyltransferase
MRIPEFTEDQIRLLETVYAGFVEAGDWPTTAYVDWKLDSEHGLDIDVVLVTMPTDIVIASGGYGEQSTIKLTIAALHSVKAASVDLQRMVDVIRFAADRERATPPGPRDPSRFEVASSEAQTIFGEIPTPDDLVRVLSLMRLDATNSGSGGPDADGNWTIYFDRGVRPFRGVQNIGEYLALRPDPPQRVWAAPPPTEPYVFVLMPFETDWSTNVKSTIGQVCDRMAGQFQGLHWERADDMTEPGRITDQIISAIERADVVIADITDANPNVLFELGYADALKKRIIVLNQRVEDTPFDIKDWRQIIYSPSALPSLATSLANFLAGTLRVEGFDSTR